MPFIVEEAWSMTCMKIRAILTQVLLAAAVDQRRHHRLRSIPGAPPNLLEPKDAPLLPLRL
jgi:hypothetical protein